MQTRHAVLLLALIGSFGAAALAIAAHRSRLSLELAQRIGGEEARNAIQASTRFGHVQELGFLALALIFLALFLMHMSLKSARVVESPRFTSPAEAEPKATLSIPAETPAPAVEAVAAPVEPQIAQLPAAIKEESAAPHA